MFVRYEKKLAKEELEKLVNAFKQNIKAYHSEDYLEANVRAEYINQFLIIFPCNSNNIFLP